LRGAFFMRFFIESITLLTAYLTACTF